MCSSEESWAEVLPVHRMDPKFTFSVLLFSLTVHVKCDPHLSKQDVALLSDEENPKCFTRNLDDFTCFWEAPVGKSYEFFYKTDENSEESRCNVTGQIMEEERILHVCFFPAEDVYLFTSIHLRVVETHTNTTTYTRKVDIAENLLLDPPSNISLHFTGEAGQLLVKWQKSNEFATHLYYEIHYCSALQDKAIVVKNSKCEHRLVSLTPGVAYTVQMRIKPNSSSMRGHWSDWSASVTAMVPQPAVDIDLECHTPDLKQVQCKWNEGQYKSDGYSLHYRKTQNGTWGGWSICSRTANSILQCDLDGEDSTMFKVYLTAELKPHKRIFYMDMFRMKNTIKTKAPEGLKEENDGERHCLRWDSPLPAISQHLIYQIRYQTQGETEWKLFTVPSPKISTCLDMQVGSQYSIQVKAMPNGSLYSGQWSTWSKSLKVQLPSNTGLPYIALVPLILLTLFVVMFSLSRYVRLKQVLWPPVPNLNDVLESFLKDLSGQHWEPKFSIKLCDEDIPASVVEIMYEGDNQFLRKPSNCPQFPQHGSLAGDRNVEYAVDGLEMNREYVTLNTEEHLPCLTGNDYVCKVNSTSGQAGDILCCCSSVCYTTFSNSSTNILNHSYVQARVGEAQMLERHYTNLENIATSKVE
ncbi:thrombopoietin receptor isoform X2 [Hoplias malabaricus]|uniref:thrombopoietin receptor isoform X2 n=1 Tax=Hoplias malabaricus TaxID=27720 RepID=UPI0034621262